ncbi:MAG TPA: hypothetical protein VJH92_02585 [Candidatus Nanoarchaeia archaeon]|nr:hypothetical protein [Candidatus Nanoarchaeia archaeon]
MQNLPVPIQSSLPAQAESRLPDLTGTRALRHYHHARPSNRRRILVPFSINLDGGWRQKGRVTVINSKAPKLRARPGEFVELNGELLKKYQDKLWEVIYCFRVKGDHNWRYCLSVRKSVIQDDGKDEIGKALDSLGCGSKTPRVIYGQFMDDMAAFNFFADIPHHGDSIVLTNQQMLSGNVKVVSSGTVNSNAVVVR